jgi:hypothetical protein
MRKTKIRRKNKNRHSRRSRQSKQSRRSKQNRRNKQTRRNRQRQAGNVLIHNFLNEKTPAAQNSYLEDIMSDQIGEIIYQVESGHFSTHWKPIELFFKKLSRYKMLSYQGNLDPPPPTFIDELYKNRIELLKIIEEIELIPNLYYKYKALWHHPGAHHYSKTIKKKIHQMLIEDSNNEKKLPDIIKNMEKNVLPLAELIKRVIEMEIVKRKRQ